MVLKPAVPIITLTAVYIVHVSVPDVYPEGYEPEVYGAFLRLCMGVYAAAAAAGCFIRKIRIKLAELSWLLAALFILVELLDIMTLKTGILRLPFIPSPDKILETAVTQYDVLTESFFASMKLLFTGLFFGVLSGLISGLLMGWSRICSYWFTPVLKIIGPMPSAAWLPIVMVLFPTGYVAGVFLIALSVWFPLTLNFSSAIRGTDKKLIETARVLGASERYILFHVAIPSVFTGLFMGFSASFGTLVVAEMLGVKAGLGWYISWSQSWAEYGRLFFTVLIFIVIFTLLMSLLFRVRDRLLKWQKGTVRW